MFYTIFRPPLYWCTPHWALKISEKNFDEYLRFSLGKRIDLKLVELSSLFISNKITISWLYLLNGFRFISLLRDSENDLYFNCNATRRPGRPRPCVDRCVAQKTRDFNISCQKRTYCLHISPTHQPWKDESLFSRSLAVRFVCEQRTKCKNLA